MSQPNMFLNRLLICFWRTSWNDIGFISIYKQLFDVNLKVLYFKSKFCSITYNRPFLFVLLLVFLNLNHVLTVSPSLLYNTKNRKKNAMLLLCTCTVWNRVILVANRPQKCCHINGAGSNLMTGLNWVTS